MLNELFIFSLLLALRWKINTLYPELTESFIEWFFVLIIAVSGICYLLNRYFKHNFIKASPNDNLLMNTRSLAYAISSKIEITASFFIPFLAIFLVRSFVFDTSYIVSGSMKPTLQVGDVALIKKYCYGLHLPFKKGPLLSLSEPKRGDIATFRLPQNTSKVYIKRIIGVSGDCIGYHNKRLTVNGHKISQRFLSMTQGDIHDAITVESEEVLNNKKYKVYTLLENTVPSLGHHPSSFSNALTLQVPEGHYCVIGDNRDNSLDSRYFGFIPKECLLGQADRIIFSFNQGASWKHPLEWIRLKRIGTKIV